MRVASYLYEVRIPMLHPVRARVGDVIAVRPGHPVVPVAVMREIAGQWQLVEIGPPNYGPFITLEDDGVLTEIFASPAAGPLAAHPLVRSA